METSESGTIIPVPRQGGDIDQYLPDFEHLCRPEIERVQCGRIFYTKKHMQWFWDFGEYGQPRVAHCPYCGAYLSKRSE